MLMADYRSGHERVIRTTLVFPDGVDSDTHPYASVAGSEVRL